MSVDNEMLRSLVREALRDALASSGKLPNLPAAPASPAAVTELVSLNSNAELFAFVQRILDMATDSATANRLRSGQIRFELPNGAQSSAAPASVGGAASTGNGLRVDRGAVTENLIKKAAEQGGTLIAGPGAVITPLARERARKLGVTITKETSSTRRDR